MTPAAYRNSLYLLGYTEDEIKAYVERPKQQTCAKCGGPVKSAGAVVICRACVANWEERE